MKVPERRRRADTQEFQTHPGKAETSTVRMDSPSAGDCAPPGCRRAHREDSGGGQCHEAEKASDSAPVIVRFDNEALRQVERQAFVGATRLAAEL